jgi:hypothetical protein
MKKSQVELYSMLKALVEDNTKVATEHLSKYLSRKTHSKLHETYSSDDGPHNNWGTDEEPEWDFDVSMDDKDVDFDGKQAHSMGASDPENFDPNDPDAELPRGDVSIDDLDAEGGLDQAGAGERQFLTFERPDQAEAAAEILAKWGIDAEMKQKSGDQGGTYLMFDGDDEMRAALNDELDKIMSSEV